MHITFLGGGSVVDIPRIYFPINIVIFNIFYHRLSCFYLHIKNVTIRFLDVNVNDVDVT